MAKERKAKSSWFSKSSEPKLLIGDSPLSYTAQRACNKFSWLTGEAEFFLGLAAIALAIAFGIFPEPSATFQSYFAVCLIIVLTAIVFSWVAPKSVREELIIPYGINLRVKNTREIPRYIQVFIVITFLALAGFAIVSMWELPFAKKLPVLLSFLITLFLLRGYLVGGSVQSLNFGLALCIIGYIASVSTAISSKFLLVSLLLAFAVALIPFGIKQFMSIVNAAILDRDLKQISPETLDDKSSKYIQVLLALYLQHMPDPRFLPHLIDMLDSNEKDVIEATEVAIARAWGKPLVVVVDNLDGLMSVAQFETRIINTLNDVGFCSNINKINRKGIQSTLSSHKKVTQTIINLREHTSIVEKLSSLLATGGTYTDKKQTKIVKISAMLMLVALDTTKAHYGLARCISPKYPNANTSRLAIKGLGASNAQSAVYLAPYTHRSETSIAKQSAKALEEMYMDYHERYEYATSDKKRHEALYNLKILKALTSKTSLNFD